MPIADILSNQSKGSKSESFDNRFARQLIQMELERRYGPSDTAKLVTGVVAGGIGVSLLYILFFRKKK